MSRRVIFVDPEIWTRPKENGTVPEDEYRRLVAFTRLLWDVAEALRLKGRAEAADIVHAEAVHFATERDIARAMTDVELDTPVQTVDLGRLSDD